MSVRQQIQQASTPLRTTDLRTTAGLAGALRPGVLRLARRLRQMRDENVELNSNQLSAMGVLFNGGELLMGELAEREKVRPPSMTRIVNDLCEQGFAVRRPGEADRRQTLVSLTDAGREMVLANRRRRDSWLAVRLAELTPTERDVLRAAIPILEKVNHA